MPGLTRRRNIKAAKAIPAPVPVPTKKPVETISYLDKLPSELAELIVRELRESTTPIKKQANKPAKRPECRCKMTPAARRSKENFNLARAPLETYSDPAWPLANHPIAVYIWGTVKVVREKVTSLHIDGAEHGHVNPPRSLQIRHITQLLPNLTTLDLNWDGDWYESDIPYPKARPDEGPQSLKRLAIMNSDGSDAGEVGAIISHLNPPVLEELEVKITCYEEKYGFADGCERLKNAILGLHSPHLKRVIIHVQLFIFVPMTTTVWAVFENLVGHIVKSTNVESIRICAEYVLMGSTEVLESIFATDRMGDFHLVKALVPTKSRVMAWLRGLKYYRHGRRQCSIRVEVKAEANEEFFDVFEAGYDAPLPVSEDSEQDSTPNASDEDPDTTTDEERVTYDADLDNALELYDFVEECIEADIYGSRRPLPKVHISHLKPCDISQRTCQYGVIVVVGVLV